MTKPLEPYIADVEKAFKRLKGEPNKYSLAWQLAEYANELASEAEDYASSLEPSDEDLDEGEEE